MSDLRALYQEAFDAFTSQEYDEAIARYQRVIEADPTFPLAYQGLAEVYSRKGQLEEAVRAIRKAIELEPDESLFHTSLSRFLQMQGRISEAEEAAAIAGRLQPRGGL
jgi:tetratricopeptide (TPR) repeat protein